MILHIVRSGETIRNIADNYQCDISDVTSNNLHITDFNNLKAGMKLKIPFLTKPVMDTLEETESFISDYYPSLKSLDINDMTNDDLNVEEKNVILEKEEITPKTKTEKREKELMPYGSYFGNVKPNIPKEFLKKI